MGCNSRCHPITVFLLSPLMSPSWDFTPEAEDMPDSGHSMCSNNLPAPSWHRTCARNAGPGGDRVSGWPGQCLRQFWGVNDQFTTVWLLYKLTSSVFMYVLLSQYLEG